jgi:ribosomal protein S9
MHRGCACSKPKRRLCRRCVINTHTIEQLFAIASSIALIVAALAAWGQLQSLKIQIREARDGVLGQIDANKTTQRLAATLTLLMHTQTNPHWIENRQRFVTLRDSKDGLKKYAQGHSEEAFSIRAMLNQYEMIAIGIGQGILDEQMYRTYYRGTALKDWTASIEFVTQERQENSNYWIAFQHLAERFRT